MACFLEGFTPYREEDAETYNRLRWWPGLTLGDLLDKAADIYPGKEAFCDGKNRLTFAQAREKTNKLAIALINLGIAPQDRVLIQLPNWNEFPLAYFAVQKIGGIVVLSIDRHRQYELGHLADLTGATAWIVPGKYKKTEYLPIVQDVIKERPQLRHVILARSEGYGTFLSVEKLIEETILDDASLRRLADRRPDPMAVAHMGPTGGTTGLPKVVPRTHNSLICGAEYVTYAWDMDRRDVCLLAGPIGHDLTFTKGLLCSLFTLAKTVFLDSMDMKVVCETIEREKVTAIPWVPTLAKRLIDFEGLKDYDLSSVRGMYCGGGVSLPEVVKGVQDKLHRTFYNSYGGTEGQSTIVRSDESLETVLHTVGKPTCPYDTYRVVSPEGKELPLNTSGELMVKGPGVFTGYYKAPKENATAFTEEGFFRTGDLARVDERGNITLTGRIKEMINRGGESISAKEIETLITGHPDVVNVAVIAMPDPQLGERVCAYVQCRPGVCLSFEGIITYLKEQKASVLHLPERIEFIAALPLTKVEKVDKMALVQDIKRKLGMTRGECMENLFSETVLYRTEYPLAWVELHRPQALNALNKEVFETLGKILDDIAGDDQVRAVILTGAGEKAFAAGADVEELRSLTTIAARAFALAANTTQEKLSGLSKPTIAALNGFTLGGGCELAMCCDIRIASEKARLGQPEINLGIIPGGGGTQRLSRLVGIAKAKELIFTGRIMTAQEALQIGLVDRIVKPEELLEAAKKLALEIAGKSGPAMALAKRSIDEGFEMNLRGALHYEMECFAECFSTDDHHEGIGAFLEKRAPGFRHR